jgi:hypothetical protein
VRHQTVAHEEVLKACREQWHNERCGKMISNTTDLVDPEVGQRREWPKASADCLLSLAAAPHHGLDDAELDGADGYGGIPKDRHARHTWRDLLEQFQPFPAQAIFTRHENR